MDLFHLRSKGKEGARKVDLSAVFNQHWIISKTYIAVFNLIFSLHTVSLLNTYAQFLLKSVSPKHILFHSGTLE